MALPRVRPLSAVLLADVDGTLIPYYGSLEPLAVDALKALDALGVEVVPVTAKSAAEVWSLWSESLGRPPRLAVVESGGAIYAEPGLLSRPDREETLPGGPAEALELAPRIEEWRGLLLEALEATGCRGFATLAEAPRRLAEKITLLRGRAAELAAARSYLEVIYHSDPGCLDRAAAEAEARGLYAFRSRRLLHVALHGGKRRAVEALLAEPALRHAPLLAAAGDSPADAEILEAADEAFLVATRGRPWLRGHPRPYHPLPLEPPEAVAELARMLSLKLAPPRL